MSPAIDRFEDLIAWKKARLLTAEVYRATDAGRFAQDFALKHQIRQAAISIMSNIAEGFERARSSVSPIPVHCQGILRRAEIATLYRGRCKIPD
jgi:hypothetical protein